MATNMKRFTISLTPELEQDLSILKKDQFYDKAQSEMVRHLIQLGIEANKKSSDPKRIA